jgi:hypothetical protein
MATFQAFDNQDIKSTTSYLNQLVDIIGSDVSSSATRREYQVFVTGGLGPGVTSSLFQTVFDQDFTLQTANPVFDITYGYSTGSSIVSAWSPTIDANGKYIFPANSLMMREKIDIYRLFARELLGDETATFTATAPASNNTIEIKEAVFVCFKRLFARDKVKRETTAIRFFMSASGNGVAVPTPADVAGNIIIPGVSSSILTDINSSTNKYYTVGGEAAVLVDSAVTTNPYGLLFLDRGIMILDMSRSFDQKTFISGAISSVEYTSGINGNMSASLCMFGASASIDDFLDHLCSTRFTASNETAMTFQNVTNINSTIFFCRANPDSFNYSSNPTFIDDNNRIVVIDEGQELEQEAFTFVSSIGLYDDNNNLLGVSKLSRPVLKDSERDITFKVRLDF